MIISAKVAIAYLLFFIGLAILFTLGWWQLTRGLEKASIESLSETGKTNPIVQVDKNQEWEQLSYRTVELEGRWQFRETMLLENRLYEGRPGYEVLVPYELVTDKSWILVNRGWIKQQSIQPGGSHADLLDKNLSVAPRGQLYLPELGFTLGETLIQPLTKPIRFLYYDFSTLSGVLEHDLVPAVLVLDSDHPASFQQIWKPGAISSERHYAYVAQWWGLALTLFIFGLIWRKRHLKSILHD
ncbi:MAG: SURF1 family protein [Acidiferrobacterales bacterium]|nr:SURF1 family protein [Acidiferrobacterales bacterium]